jgi:hypothetical protein
MISGQPLGDVIYESMRLTNAPDLSLAKAKNGTYVCVCSSVISINGKFHKEKQTEPVNRNGTFILLFKLILMRCVQVAFKAESLRVSIGIDVV